MTAAINNIAGKGNDDLFYCLLSITEIIDKSTAHSFYKKTYIISKLK